MAVRNLEAEGTREAEKSKDLDVGKTKGGEAVKGGRTSSRLAP